MTGRDDRGMGGIPRGSRARTPSPEARRFSGEEWRAGSQAKASNRPPRRNSPSALVVDKRREGSVGAGPVVLDNDDGAHWQRTVQMRKHHRRRVARHAGLPVHRRPEPIGVEVEQDQIAVPGKNPIGRQMHLSLGGKVNESDGGLRPDLTTVAGGLPLGPAAQMDEQLRIRVHPATLHEPHRRRYGRVRHDTSAWRGNKPASQNV